MRILSLSTILILITSFAAESNQNFVERTAIDLANWMSHPTIQKKALNMLLLPTTHDTAAFVLDLPNTPTFTKNRVLQTIKSLAESEVTGWLIRPFLNRLAVAQNSTILQQLNQGIRGLDLRILWNVQQQQFYLCHSFSTIKLTDGLSDIVTFMQNSPHEILFITMQYDKDFTAETEPLDDQAIQLVHTYLGQWLAISADTSKTVSSLVASKQRIFFSFTDPYTGTYNYALPKNFAPIYWSNQRSASDSIQKITHYIESSVLATPYPNALQGIFFTVTPDEITLIKNFLGNMTLAHNPTSLEAWSRDMEPLSIDLIQRYHCSLLKGLNLVAADYPSKHSILTLVQINITGC